MKTIVKIFLLVIFTACTGKHLRPSHSHVFNYVDKNSADTTRFYAYMNLDSAIYHANRNKKNVLLIFSCWACMATSGMEWKTLLQGSDVSRLYDNFIICWLPVDDKKPLKDTLRFPLVRWPITTVGLLNAYQQQNLTKTSLQPTFCFLDNKGKLYGQLLHYTLDKKEVEAFIMSGLTK